MSNSQIIRAFIRQRFALVVLALIANVLDSCTNAALLLSLGKYVSLQSQENSAKSGIFDFIFSGIDTTNQLVIFFCVGVAMKAILTMLDYWLSQLLGDAFVSYVRQKSLQSLFAANSWESTNKRATRLTQSASSDMQNVRDLFTKGLLEFTADFSYFILLSILFYVINPNLFYCLMLALPLFALFSYWLGNSVSVSKNNRSEKRGAIYRSAERVRERLLTITAFNLAKREQRRWSDRELEFERASKTHGLRVGMAESVMPLLFFGLVGFVLFSFTTSTSDKTTTMSFILLLLYAQSSLRRSMRVYSVWKVGVASLAKLEILSNEILDEKEVQEFDLQSVQIHEHGAGEVELRKGEIMHVHQSCELQELIDPLFFSKNDEELIVLKSASSSQPTLKQRRKTIGVVSEEMVLNGKNVLEAVHVFAGNADKKSKAESYLDAWKLNLLLTKKESAFEVNSLSKLEKLKLQLIRLRLSNRKVIVLHQVFDGLTRNETMELADCLIELKKNRFLIIIGTLIPEGFPVRKKIDALW
jgi:ABC-type multidrug transport system fused ATPase/permease subunit